MWLKEVLLQAGFSRKTSKYGEERQGHISMCTSGPHKKEDFPENGVGVEGVYHKGASYILTVTGPLIYYCFVKAVLFYHGKLASNTVIVMTNLW